MSNSVLIVLIFSLIVSILPSIVEMFPSIVVISDSIVGILFTFVLSSSEKLLSDNTLSPSLSTLLAKVVSMLEILATCSFS